MNSNLLWRKPSCGGYWKYILRCWPVKVGIVARLKVPVDTASLTFLKRFKNMARSMTEPHSIK